VRWNRGLLTPSIGRRGSSSGLGLDSVVRVARFVRFVALATLPLLAGCEMTPAPAAKTPAAAIVWRSLGTWSGRGDRQTESFTVETGALRLRWETKDDNPPGAGRFRVSLYSAISGRPLQTIVDREGVGADTAYLEDEPRVSYLVIESAQVEWTAVLEEAVPTVGGGPSPP